MCLLHHRGFTLSTAVLERQRPEALAAELTERQFDAIDAIDALGRIAGLRVRCPSLPVTDLVLDL